MLGSNAGLGKHNPALGDTPSSGAQPGDRHPVPRSTRSFSWLRLVRRLLKPLSHIGASQSPGAIDSYPGPRIFTVLCPRLRHGEPAAGTGSAWGSVQCSLRMPNLR